LDDAWGDTCFGEELVDEVVGIGGHWGGLPDDHIADKGRSCDEENEMEM
jgi:hypothetical protein